MRSDGAGRCLMATPVPSRAPFAGSLAVASCIRNFAHCNLVLDVQTAVAWLPRRHSIRVPFPREHTARLELRAGQLLFRIDNTRFMASPRSMVAQDGILLYCYDRRFARVATILTVASPPRSMFAQDGIVRSPS